MIMMKRKQLDEILSMLSEFDNVLVLGCNGCAGIYQVGGEKQAEVEKTLLGMATELKQNRNIKIGATTVLRQCDRQIVETSLKQIVKDYDSILSLACGVGVQTLADVFEDKVILPANDTVFMGAQDRELGISYELCKACGECMLFETAGICPITRCAKGLMNGPCGGMVKGKCEVGGLTKDCAWVLIYNRLKKRNRLDLFEKFREPKDFQQSQHPRELGGIEEEEKKE